MKRTLIFMWLVASTAFADPAARFQGSGEADPIRVGNVRELGSPVAETGFVAFDLAWDHSWRAAWEEPADRHGGDAALKLESWDAAWVFVKFRKKGGGGWSHATLSLDAADHVVSKGAKLDVGPSDDGKRGLGVFVYRAQPGSGANDWKDVTLAWQNLADGVESTADVELKVFAIQMVYVPQVAFWLGDGSKNRIPAGEFSAGDTDAPFRVESEDAIVLGGVDQNNLGNRDGLGMERAEDFTSQGAQVLPGSFPKGYAAFYCMRNELTEGQFVDCINTLDAARGQHLKPFEESRTGIVPVAPAEAGTPAVYRSDQPHAACSLLWLDAGFYAAWAGLRPMTELEFEKACRGPLVPVPNEYAWGTAGIAGKDFDKLFPDATHGGYVVRQAGRPDESVRWQGDDAPDARPSFAKAAEGRRGNAAWYGAIRRTGPSGRHGQVAEDAIKSPLRPGVFATPTSGRVEAGASYWGILDLSGNLWERVVTVGNPYGRRFTGAHGEWPIETDPERFGMGTGIRGGSLAGWLSEVTEPPKESRRLRVSDREKVGRSTPISREWNRGRSANFAIGFRGARTAEIRQAPAVPPTDRAAPRAPAPQRHSMGGGKTLRKVADWLDWKVEISNLAAVRRDEKTAVLTFDIAWKDSWRDEHNHDAAWLFFKVRTDENAPWQHVRLTADRVLNPTGCGQAEGGTRLEFLVPDGEDGFTGLFVRRAEEGEGALAANKVSVVCELRGDLDGISVRAFGIRMVYVPEGAYHLGSGGLEPGGFYRYSDGRQHIQAYEVTGPGAIPTGREAGRLWTRRHGSPPEDGGSIPAAFPNGFAAFYCMKHQIAPAQYAAFLNTLTGEQADERYAGAERWAMPAKDGRKAAKARVHYSGGQGQVIRTDEGYSGKSAGPRAGPGCFGLSWADGAAFAAWAGLRPMTELELEKAVRGFREPMPDEVGPSYWGIGGFNNWDWDAFKGDCQSERAVTVGNVAGRRFTGSHGRGTLTLPEDWPQADAVGSGLRCTHYMPSAGRFDHNWSLQRPRLSDRLLAAVADPERNPSHKWRGVRTAPREAERPTDARTFTNSMGMRFAPIPAGTFQMGSPENEKDREKQEVRHEVVLTKGFYMGVHEVTVGQFRRFVEAAKFKTEAERDGKGGWGVSEAGSFDENGKFTWKSPGFEQGDDHPVVLVSWNDAKAFCRWLSQKEKATYRLPTEAEWEYACRAGTETAYQFGDDPRLLTRYGNLFHHPSLESKDGHRFTAPVGRFKPNDRGLFDMHGNVWEWCEDGYDPAGYSREKQTDPTGPESAKARVQRGGGWSSAPHRCRSAARVGRDPSSYRGAYLGFRIVLEK